MLPIRPNSVDDSPTSPALSQIGSLWPVDGRQVGIIADHTTNLDDLAELRTGLYAAGITPLVVAPHGGQLGDSIGVQRTYATAASVEFDAIALTTASSPAPDAQPGRDARAADPSASYGSDPRVARIIAEAWRHAKPIAAIGDSNNVLEAAGLPTDAPGVVTGSATNVARELASVLASHRAWDRFPATA